MHKKTIKDISLVDKAVLVRVDYNVSLTMASDGPHIADDTRIRQSLPTLQYLLAHHPKRVILMSHLGEPTGEDSRYSLRIVSQRLSQLLGSPVIFQTDYLSPTGQTQCEKYHKGEIILLENVRFHKEEETNNPIFASKLAKLGDIFVNDAFGSSHRAHASVVGVAEYLPAVAGLLLEKELLMIGNALEAPEHPFVVILGGAKATTKIPMIERLMTKADYMLLGGGVANTFLKAFGYHVGRSVYSRESLRLAQNLIWKATRVNTRLFLPSDVVIGSYASQTKIGTVPANAIPMQFQALDIGAQTAHEFAQIIAQAKTIIWNGPVGANESVLFQSGTEAIYRAIISNHHAVSIVGGGDTLASIKGHDHMANISHISTGGGAMLEYIEKGTLPGVEILTDR